jgi:hypothetical protein
MNMHHTKSPTPYANRSKRWRANTARPDLRVCQDAQKNYERYLTLAQTQAQSGDRIGNKNFAAKSKRLSGVFILPGPPRFTLCRAPVHFVEHNREVK